MTDRTTMTDRRGCEISHASAAALDGFEEALALFNGYFADPFARIEAVLGDSPDMPMALALKGGLLLCSTEAAMNEKLAEVIAAGQAMAGRMTARERGHFAALAAWHRGDLAGAGDHYARVLADHPRDLLALQVAHQVDFFQGRSMMLRDRPASVLRAWDGSVPGFGFVLGMHAFGLEEMGEYGRAEEQGNRALALNRADAWAVHAVAHVMEMQGRTDEGAAFLEGRRDDWAPESAPGNMLAYHNWWHLALHHLDTGGFDAALAIYDTAIRPGDSRVALELVDASAMLWRLWLRGVDVGNRFASVADAWETLADDAWYAFNDVHAMMAFVATGRPASQDRAMASLSRAARGGGTNAMMAREVGLPASRALAAFGAGQYRAAAEQLAALHPIAHRFGGSHAQRDVIHLTALEAATRAGDRGLARALATQRLVQKPHSPFNQAAFARASALAAPASA
ncbi:tetratricopeptide repeat protein [Elioraea sp.]|uniref:tetratricopeptide repeat protein n=1 Tax=Elioraea sp. TaxID=2185103 RepID=UPI0025C360AC|nr:tetratricopeptide repeat protein [Elioraea sp.]